jgi:hypothetical protein
MKFTHFERYSLSKGKYGYSYDNKDGITTNTVQTYLNLDEEFEVEFELTINQNGGIDVVVLNPSYYSKLELKDINKVVKKMDWNGWEYMTFFDIRTNSIPYPDGSHRTPHEWRLVADENSKTFDVMNSAQNLNNLDKVSKALKKFI